MNVWRAGAGARAVEIGAPQSGAAVRGARARRGGLPWTEASEGEVSKKKIPLNDAERGWGAAAKSSKNVEI